VITRPAIKSIAQRGNQRTGSSFNQWEAIWNYLENIIAILAKQQVTGLPVSAAGQHIISSTAENPFFSRTARENVIARSSKNDIPPQNQHVAGEVFQFRGREIQGGFPCCSNGCVNLITSGGCARNFQINASVGTA